MTQLIVTLVLRVSKTFVPTSVGQPPCIKSENWLSNPAHPESLITHIASLCKRQIYLTLLLHRINTYMCKLPNFVRILVIKAETNYYAGINSTYFKRITLQQTMCVKTETKAKVGWILKVGLCWTDLEATFHHTSPNIIRQLEHR